MENRPRYRVPDELRETLLDFTIAYLLERPSDLPAFGVNFFQRLRDEHDLASGGGQHAQAPAITTGGGGTGRVSGGRASGTKHVSIGNNNGSGPNAVEEDDEPPPQVRNTGRRKSVFAEAYNPEEDKDEQPSVVYPKSDVQKERLGEAVKHILLFRSLEPEQMHEVIDAMFERKVGAGEYVITQGDDGDNFYVIESGRYKVFVQAEGEEAPRAVGAYDNSGSFGELALMYNMPRAATVQAETDGSLWAMDRQTFRKIVLKSAFKKRQMYETLLDSVPMLQTLTAYERMNLADALFSKHFSNGETIIRQGDVGDGMYFIEDGTVRVSIEENGHETELTRISNGGYFGELALLTEKPRAATVHAVGNVKCAFLDVEAFERLLGPCMEVMKRNAKEYENQLIQLFGSRTNITDIRWK